MSNRWSNRARQNAWSSIRCLSSKMSGRYRESTAGGWFVSSLTLGIPVLDSPGALDANPAVFTIPVMSSGGASSSTMHVGKRSSAVAALRSHWAFPGRGFVASVLTSEGRCYCASSQLISSIIAIGGVPGLCLRLVAAKDNALSKLQMRLRLDSALYHAAPLRDFPRSLGMVRAAACSAISLPDCDGGRKLQLNRMNTARVQFPSPLFISSIKHHTIMPAEAIKAGLLLLWLQVQIPRARGLIDGRCLVWFMRELMFKGRFAG